MSSVRFTSGAALAALCCAVVPARAAPDDDWRRAFDELSRRFEEQKARDDARIRELEQRLAERPEPHPNALQAQIDDLLDRTDALTHDVAAVRATGAGGRTAYLDIAFNSLLTVGASSAGNGVVGALEGGHHDPHRRGFTVQNTELALSGAVDPYLKGFANMVQTIDADGETVVELEEAYAQTTSLPYGLQVKAGQYFTEFGRQNPTHPHQWEFVNAPVATTRVFGADGMRGPGARVSWLLPTPFPAELIVGAQNANGETMAAFVSEEPPFGAVHRRDVRSFRDLAWTARATASFDVTDETPLLVGVSGASGPSGASDARNSSVVGADLTLKWKPLANDRGFPFVAAQAEWLARDVGYDSFRDGRAFVPAGRLSDAGGYGQVVWGFTRDWTAGVRYDRVRGTDDDVLGRDDRGRWSLAVTWYSSEFAKLRLQLQRDDATALDDAVGSVWLQLEFDLGSHGAHKF